MANLVFYSQGVACLSRPVDKLEISLGRDPTCDIQLLDEEISRKHCTLSWRDGAYYLKDSSRNGTYVRGESITECHLHGKDKFQIGPWEILFSEDESTPTPQTKIRPSETTQILEYENCEKRLTVEKLELQVQGPKGEKREEKFSSRHISIGAMASNDLVLDFDPYISKQHCQILWQEDRYILKDLGSRNGTFCDGQKIDQVPLAKEGEFVAGQSTIRYKLIRAKEKLKHYEDDSLGPMVGVSREMKEVFALIEKLAASEATVCLIGESGTGKELAAKCLHDFSGHHGKPFVALNCGAIPQNLIESELFGHEKGSFTGASERHLGVFEQAHQGTLFLDEIGEMPEEAQIRLLRAIENRSIRRIGGKADISVTVRLICATHRDLKELLSQGKFREDLFYRIYVIPIFIPPLRERASDIPLLVKHFLRIFSPKGEEKILTEAALKKLTTHPWRGNVRELRNVLQRALLLTSAGAIDADAIVLENLSPSPRSTDFTLEDREKQAIKEALIQTKGNASQAARRLHISRSSLTFKLKRLGIDPKAFG